MDRKKLHYPWLIAGLIAAGTALLHVFQGQTDLVRPLMACDMDSELLSQWLGVWHFISVGLVLGALLLLWASRAPQRPWVRAAVTAAGAWYLAGGLAFVVVSMAMQTLAPQWVLLLPIGGLALWPPGTDQP